MSYCRWSSDDFQCNVYVYESHQGFEVHVASNRVVWDPPPPPPVALTQDTLMEWLARQRIVMDRMDEIERVPIGLPYDGASRTFDSPGWAAAFLKVLQDLGYVVPSDVIADLDMESGDWQ